MLVLIALLESLFVGALAYAHDIVLLVLCAHAMHRLLAVFDEYDSTYSVLQC